MKIFKTFEEASVIRNPVVTTGSFDGVHIGHKTILNRLKMLARKYDGESVLITFYPHPRKVLYPETAGKDLRLITSQEEKLYLLQKAGLDNVIIVEFTREFSRITSEEFVRDFLHEKLNAKVVVAGFNHHFGFNKEGDYRQLWAMRTLYNFEAEEIPEQEVMHETVSSTRIRQAIREGYIQKANAYLDHYYLVMGKPERYPYRNNFYEINLAKVAVTEECKLLPLAGVYAVSMKTGNTESKGMALIGSAQEGEQEVLINVIEGDPIKYGTELIVLFHKRIQGPVNLANQTDSARWLKAARNEVSELIF
ncbi:MAG: riboflavin biosynthesis protein RibF [Bacteroidales bacterium]|nr:riboflavin biosynthesis protein RibF [Bacteroidales bacterium]